MLEYNKNMKIVEYTESKEIEIVENFEDKANMSFIMYFKDLDHLVELISSNPEIAKKIKERL